MANEFIARNGITSLGNIVVSGSITSTGTVTISGSIASASFASTASSADNFLARGTITAQTLVVQTITSSIDWVTGSAKFGSINSNTHTFTGSVAISGSSIFGLNVNNGALYVSASGNVGIGTTSPSYKLEVYASSGYAARLDGATYGGLQLSAAGTTNSYIVGESSILTLEHNTAIKFRTNNGDRMTITSGGNVLIGTTSDGSGKLQVSGSNSSIIAQIKSPSGMLQLYPFFSAYSGPIIQALDGAGSSTVPLRIECSAVTVTGAATFSSSVTGTIFDATSNAYRFSGNNALSLVSLNTQNVVKINAAGYWGSQMVGSNDQGILVNNSGFVGIHNNGPSYRLSVSSGNGTFIQYGDNGYLGHYIDAAYLMGGGQFNSAGTWTARSTTAVAIGVNETGGSIGFFTNTGLTSGNTYSPTERMRITNDGYLRLASKGIQFNGDTADANSLDDYEEGIHSPTVTAATGTITLDSGYDSLSYVKVGTLVHVTGYLNVSSVSSPTGNVRITMPFTCANLNDAAGTGAAVVFVDSSVSAPAGSFFGYIDETDNRLIVAVGDAVTWGNSGPQMKTGTALYISLCYRTT